MLTVLQIFEDVCQLLLLRIARETFSNLVGYWTHSFHISLLEHYIRSSSSNLLVVPNRVKTVTASRAFRVAAPTIWNNLPDSVEVADSFNVFLSVV